MSLHPASKSGPALLAILGGMGMFLMVAFAYAGIAAYQPFYYVVGRSNLMAKAVGTVYLAVVMGFWAFLWRWLLNAKRELILTGAAFLGAFAITALIARIAGYEFDEVFLFYVGWCSWWAGLILIAIALPIFRAVPKPVVPGHWKWWAAVGIAALALGLAIHLLGGHYSRVVLLTKTVLIIFLPSMCSLGIALRSGAPLVLRIAAVSVALVGIAGATVYAGP
jgi:hypothetical protein